MFLPTLYARTSNGSTQQWSIEVVENTFRTHEGLKDGKITISLPTVCEAKNVGRANETTPEDQALSEAKSKWQKKLDSGYYEDISKIDIEKFSEPMLAKKYDDEFDASMFPVYSQPKLDGCVSGETLIKLENGEVKTIKELFDFQLKGKILSFNQKKNRNQYKKILGVFKNGIDMNEKSHKWYEIELDNGIKIKVTGNHLIYMPTHRCWRRVDELNNSDEVLVVSE